MDTKYFFALLSALGVITPQVKADDGQFAVLKPKAICEINVPPGGSRSQVYFSSDCQTAYILPSLSMQKKVLRPIVLADAKICERYNSVMDSISDIPRRKKTLRLQLERLAMIDMTQLSDSEVSKLNTQRENLKQLIADYDKEMNNATLPFAKTPALRGHITVATDVMQEVADFQAANVGQAQDDRKIYPIKIVPAQIQSAVLGITDADEKDYNGGIVKVNFPGLNYSPKEGDAVASKKEQIYIKMNGATSGIVDVGANVYCRELELAKQNGTSPELALTEIFKQAVALKLDYFVRVQAGARIHLLSVLDSQDFVHGLSNHIEKTKYTRTELMAEVLSGGIAGSLQISLDDQGMESVNLDSLVQQKDDDETHNILTPVIGGFIKDHIDRIENKLKQLKVISEMDPLKAKDMEAGTDSVYAGSKTVCSSSSSWLGLVRNSYCNTTPIYYQVDRKGISDLTKQISDDSRIVSEAVYMANQTYSIHHTSSFDRE